MQRKLISIGTLTQQLHRMVYNKILNLFFDRESKLLLVVELYWLVKGIAFSFIVSTKEKKSQYKEKNTGESKS